MPARLDADALDKKDGGDLTAVVRREVSRRGMVTLEAKPALNAFEIAFDGRLAAGRK